MVKSQNDLKKLYLKGVIFPLDQGQQKLQTVEKY